MRPLLPLAVLAVALAACGDAEAPTPADAEAVPVAPAVPAPPSPTAHTAGEGQAPDSPHGGTVKTAGGGHLELVVARPNLMVYVLDAEENTLPAAGIAGATALVQMEGGATETVALQPAGDHLQMAIPGDAPAFAAVVSVPVAGETRSARFEVGLDGDLDHAH